MNNSEENPPGYDELFADEDNSQNRNQKAKFEPNKSGAAENEFESMFANNVAESNNRLGGGRQRVMSVDQQLKSEHKFPSQILKEARDTREYVHSGKRRGTELREKVGSAQRNSVAQNIAMFETLSRGGDSDQGFKTKLKNKNKVSISYETTSFFSKQVKQILKILEVVMEAKVREENQSKTW